MEMECFKGSIYAGYKSEKIFGLAEISLDKPMPFAIGKTGL